MRRTWLGDVLFVVAALSAVVALIGGIVFVVYLAEEAGCNQKVDGNDEFVDGDYRLLSNTCFVTLTTGERVSYDRYRLEDER